MAQAQLLPPPVLTPVKPALRPGTSAFRFRSLEAAGHHSLARARGATFTLSVVVHTALVAAVIIVPVLFDDALPAPSDALRAFFVSPAEVAPPPPPPPPPAAGARVVPKAPAAARLPESTKLTAPVEIPQEMPPPETLSFGVEGGVPGGVEGGVPGGVVGGIVGGLPAEAPPPPAKVVRVGGMLRAPKILHRVQPEYPELARAARLQAMVILEAHVGTSGLVQDVKVLRGQPLFDAAAIAAVKQWRYVPLLLNGQPTEFILTVTIVFNLKNVQMD